MKAKPTTTRSTAWSKAGGRYGTRGTSPSIGSSWPTSPTTRRPLREGTDTPGSARPKEEPWI
ncbi:MAG: hypothetical protein CMI21_06210, partial [Opitutae bacterium]|nr:hypothetical protein [Opitutae bacterium]